MTIYDYVSIFSNKRGGYKEGFEYPVNTGRIYIMIVAYLGRNVKDYREKFLPVHLRVP